MMLQTVPACAHRVADLDALCADRQTRGFDDLRCDGRRDAANKAPTVKAYRCVERRDETFTLVPASWVAVVYGKGRASKVAREGFKVRYSFPFYRGRQSITLQAAGGNPGHLRDATFRTEAEARAEMTRRHPNAREVAAD